MAIKSCTDSSDPAKCTVAIAGGAGFCTSAGVAPGTSARFSGPARNGTGVAAHTLHFCSGSSSVRTVSKACRGGHTGWMLSEAGV
eukprot:312587-Pelagomonas_calceolata.AAC.1